MSLSRRFVHYKEASKRTFLPSFAPPPLVNLDNWSRPILKRSASNRARQQAITQHEKLRRQADQARRRELGEMVEDDEADEADRLATKAAAEGSQARDAAQAK